MARVLVIDDDRSVLRLVEKALEESGRQIVTAHGAAEGMERLHEVRPDVLLLDIMLPETNGLELALRVKQFDNKLPIIFVTARDDSATAIEAMKLGAYDYLLKPLDRQRIIELVERALETRRLMQSPVHLHELDQVPSSGEVLVGRCASMLDVYKQVGRVAAQDVAVLIRGESGTGKELIARAIYHHSHRKDECFLAINCAALSDTLLESELFGHEKGAFTGADRQRVGKFEQCNGGTIFLDEIGDMSLSTQSKVLRLLQEQRFERVGGSETIETDVRMISATNRDLETMIKEGSFRLDLFHRLNVFEIVLPPLRERREDIPLLVEHFMARFNQSLSKGVTAVAPEAMEHLTDYRWPGNIRELQSVLRKAILMATGPVLVPELLPDEMRRHPTELLTETSESTVDLGHFISERETAGSSNLYAETLAWMERYLISRVLQETDGNQSKAAERLGITRGSLRHKIRALGISIDYTVTAGE